MIEIKAAELRQNQKEYLNRASDGEIIKVERPGGRNVMIIGQKEYDELQRKLRLSVYAGKMAEFFRENGLPDEL